MNEAESRCVTAREALPDLAAGRLVEAEAVVVAKHLDGCESCQGELELISALYSTRVRPPAELQDRIVRALARPARGAHRPWWGLSAAAVAAIALGIGIVSDSGSDPSAAVGSGQIATEFEEGDFWVSDDGMLAGAPSFDALSDEALAELLEELAAETPGGSA